MMEYNDYKQAMNEQREEQDREDYKIVLDEFEGDIQEVLLQANKDNLELEDILEVIVKMIDDTQDIKVKIERV